MRLTFVIARSASDEAIQSASAWIASLHCVALVMTNRSRDAAERPSPFTAAFETVITDIAARRTAFFERLCGAPCRAAAGQCRWKQWQAPLRHGRRRKERKQNRKQNADRRNWYSAAPYGPGRACQRRRAHLSAFDRGPRPKEPFIARH